MAAKITIKCKLYREADDNYGTPNWSDCNKVAEAELNISWNEGDASARESRVMMTEPTLATLEITGRIRVDPDDGNYTALRDAFKSNTVLDLLALDGDKDTVGSEGVRADFKVFNFSRSEPLDGVTFRTFTLKPCVMATGHSAAQHAVVEAGPAITYTDFGG